jgi:hypothetical protein
MTAENGAASASPLDYIDEKVRLDDGLFFSFPESKSLGGSTHLGRQLRIPRVGCLFRSPTRKALLYISVVKEPRSRFFLSFF